MREVFPSRLSGATGLVEPLNASRWCETRPKDRNAVEADHLANIVVELKGGA